MWSYWWTMNNDIPWAFTSSFSLQKRIKTIQGNVESPEGGLAFTPMPLRACKDHIQKDAEIAKLNCNFIKKNKLHKFMYEQYRQNKKYIQNENGVFLARLSNATLLLLYCSFDEIKIIQKLECGVDGVPFSQSKWLSMDGKRNDHYFSPDAGKFKWEVECYIPITSRLYRVYV